MAKLPRSTPIPDDPSSLTKDQMDALLSVARCRCFTPGQRVRIHTRAQRLDGLTGVVKNATEMSAWVELDPEPDHYGPPDEILFPAEELEKLQEALDPDLDAPGPYMVALDYITPLEQANYKKIGGTYWKYFTGEQWGGTVALRVTPWEKGVYIEVDYRKPLVRRTLFQCIVPGIDATDIVRELETLILLGGADYGALKLALSKVKPAHGEILEAEAPDPDAPENFLDDPEHYVSELMDHARVINAFRDSDFSVRLHRKPSGTRKHYEMFIVRHPASDVSFEVYIEPLDDGSWVVSARGYKYFDHPRHGEVQEEFDIPQAWEIPAGLSDDDLAGLVDHISAEIVKHEGPPDLTSDTLDELDRLGESADDINFEQYAKDSAGYNPVQLLTSKEIRDWVKAAGYKVNTLYRSKRTTGWSVSAIPATDEAFAAFKEDYLAEKYRAEKILWDKFKERFPEIPEHRLQMLVYFHTWNWSGATSSDPENPRNYTLYLEMQPTDANQRKGGLPVKEGVDEPVDDPDPDLSIDPAQYARTTFEPVEFLTSSGWQLQTERADHQYWRKEFPLPRNYILGGMTFDQLVAQIGYYTRGTMAVDVNIFFNNREQKFGLPVKGWRLEPQLLGYPIEGEESYDAKMTIRRFALGIGQVLASAEWPPGDSAITASSAVQRAMAAFTHELNDRAEQPIRPEMNEALDPDAPEHYVRSLGTVAHIAARFGMREHSAGRWVRDVTLHHPMSVWLTGPRQIAFPIFRVSLLWNGVEKTAALILRAIGAVNNKDLLVWHSTVGYKSEAAAALHLNEAIGYLFQSIDDPMEAHDYLKLRQVLQMGVGPYMLPAKGEDEDPD